MYGNADYRKGVEKKRKVYHELDIDLIEVKGRTLRGNWQK